MTGARQVRSLHAIYVTDSSAVALSLAVSVTGRRTAEASASAAQALAGRMHRLSSHPALEVAQDLPRGRRPRIGQCAILGRRDDVARGGEYHDGGNAVVDRTAVLPRDIQIPVPIPYVDLHDMEIVLQV